MRKLPENEGDYLAPSKRSKEDLLESRKDRAKAREAIDLFQRHYTESEIVTRLFGKITAYRMQWLATHLRAAGL